MSSNWKLIGRNSGNMSHHRNVASNKLNYETGKWDSIYDVSGKDVKGYTFDICGQNIVLGVGTNKPFSRLSLGNNSNSGKFNANKMGQLAAIALDEKANGQAFTGILLNSDLISTETLAGATVKTTSGIQIMSSIKDFSLNDISNGQIYLTNNNVTTIGGEPRVGNEKDIASTGAKCPGTYGNRKIVLDVRGSVRTDGYINFYNQTGAGTFSPTGTSYNNTSDIPKGSLFLTNGGGSKTGAEGLYFKNTQDQITLVAGTGSGGSTSDISAAFDVSLNGTNDYQYIVNKAKDTQSDSNSGGVPVTFSGKIWPKSTYNTEVPRGFNNAVTIRDGNLAVITPSGDDLQLINAPSSSLMTDELDASGGIILAQRQLLIGSIKNDTTAAPHKRYGYGRIDIQGISNIPSLQCYNYTDPGAGDVAFKPEKATNAIILITKNATDDGSNVGPTNDCSNTIIIGGRFETIDTPNSIISNIENINSSTTAVTDISGSNIVFGYQNKLTNSCYTLIMGAENTVDNTTGATTTDAVIGRNQNNILGSSNLLFNSENSFVQGHSNKVFGNQNIVFGNTNILGNDGGDNSTYKYFTQKSFIQGNNNQITSTYEQPVQNVFIAGKNNKLDMSYNSFTTNTNSSYTLLGTYAGISGEVGDTSNVRFAIGTYEQYQANGGSADDNGNVFTIDCSGNTRIFGNLIVDGSQVILRTEIFDVSDANLSLNANNGDPNGGGITLIDTTGSGNKGLTWNQTGGPGGNGNYWDTSGSDLSTNNIYANIATVVDISGVDASFNDLSLNYLYVHNDISANDGFFQGDLSCNGKLTVGGVIDPTGLIFTVEGTPGQGLGTMAASEGGIYTDGDDLFFIPKGKSIADTADVKKFAQVASGGGSSGMTSFTLAGDTGTQTIENGNTVTIATGDGLSSAAGTTDKVTISLDTKLADIAGLTSTDSNFIVGTGTTWEAQGPSDARTSLNVDVAGTDNSTDVTLATVTSNYLSIDGQEITAGTVPVSLGGTGATSAANARSNLGVDAAGTDNSTEVTLATVASNYLSIDGQEITAGTVPVSLGGTGATSAANARSNLGVDAAGTDNSTEVTLATVASNYLSIDGQEITAGTVPVSLGGTGATSAANARSNLGVDAAGTDNSTEVTLATVASNYLSIDGQEITAGTVPVSLGGTGTTSLTDKAVLISQDTGTDAISSVAMTTDGELLIGGSSGPTGSTLTEGNNITITNSDGGITIAAASVNSNPFSSVTAINDNNGGSGHTAVDGACYTVDVDAASTTVAFTLPSASAGQKIKFILLDDGTNGMTITCAAGDFFQGYCQFVDTVGTGTPPLKIFSAGGSETLFNSQPAAGVDAGGGIITCSAVNSTDWFVDAQLFCEVIGSATTPFSAP